jgi:hypothetical protein
MPSNISSLLHFFADANKELIDSIKNFVFFRVGTIIDTLWRIWILLYNQFSIPSLG